MTSPSLPRTPPVDPGDGRGGADVPSRPPQEVKRRVAWLTAERRAGGSPADRAVLGYELGRVLEAAGRETEAAEAYLDAFREDPAFRLPLVALIALFEGRGVPPQLERLYEAEERAAGHPVEAASATLSRAVFLTRRGDPSGEAVSLLEAAARDAAGFGAAAALLEARYRRLGDGEGAARAVQLLHASVEDEELAGLLLLERARSRETAGNLPGAAELLREAAELVPLRWRSLGQLERVARLSGRAGDLVEALERQAAIAAAAADGTLARDEWPPDAGLRDEADAGNRCAALCWEAARIRLRHGDAAGAAEVLGSAVAVVPDDPALGQELVRVLDRAGDHEGAAREAQRLLDLGASGAYGAWLRFRLAAAAKARGDGEATRDALEGALEADPDSPAAAGSLEDVLLDEDRHETRIRRLEAKARERAGPVATLARWQAAQIAGDELRDPVRADRLYAAALASADDPETRRSIARERFAAAHRLGAWDRVRDAARALLDETPPPDERDAILRDLRELSLFELDRTDEADELLREALAVPRTARAWAGPIARIQGAMGQRWSLLSAAHEALAAVEKDRRVRAAHRCAAARARARAGGDDDGAIGLLREGLRDVPDHGYAVALLRELLGRRGEGGEELLALLEGTAADARGAREAETTLLRSGAAAEARGDLEGALEAYEQASDWSPSSRAPLVALRRLARQLNRSGLADRAVEALAAQEMASGRTGYGALELGERHVLPGGEPGLASWPLQAALEVEELAPAAAAATLLLPAEPRQACEEAAVAALARASAPGAPPLRPLDADDLLGALETLAEAAPGPPRVAALEALAAQPSLDEEAARAIRLSAVRAAVCAGEGELARRLAGPLLDPDAGGGSTANGPPGETLLARELLGDPTPAMLWRRLREGARAADVSPGLDLAEGRACLREGDPETALARAEAQLAQDPDDLAAWALLREAAKAAGRWRRQVDAGLRLAGEVSGDLRGALLEEAGLLLADELGADEEATDVLSRAARAGGFRPRAEARLHALLAEEEGPASAPPPPMPEPTGVEEPGGGEPGGDPPSPGARALARADALPPGPARDEAAEAAARALLEEGRRDDAARALARWLDDPGDDPAGWSRAVSLADQLGDPDLARRALLGAASGGLPEARRRALERLASLGREAGDTALERRALEDLARLAPDDPPIFARSVELERDPERRERRVARAFHRARTRLTEDPFDRGGLELLSRAAEAAGEPDLGRRAARLAAIVHPAVDRIPTVPVPAGVGSLSDDAVGSLRSPADGGLVATFARTFGDLFLRVDGLEAGSGLPGRRATPVSGDAPVAVTLRRIADLYGLEVGDISHDPDLAAPVSLLPGRRGRVSWILGVPPGDGLPPGALFVAHQLSFARRDGILAAVLRSPEEAAALVLAAAAHVDIPLKGAGGRGELPELARRFGRHLSRRQRKDLAEAVARIAEAGEDVEHWGLAAHASALRAALFGSDDAQAALEAAIRGPIDPEALRAAPLGRELAWFYVSDELTALRGEGSR